MLNSITACDFEIAFSCPCASAAASFRAVTSEAIFTIFIGLPSVPITGLYDAWIQTSLPPLPMRLYSAMSKVPLRNRSQNWRYSGLLAELVSTNMRWCLPTTSDNSYPSKERKLVFAVRMVPSIANSMIACDLEKASSVA